MFNVPNLLTSVSCSTRSSLEPISEPRFSYPASSKPGWRSITIRSSPPQSASALSGRPSTLWLLVSTTALSVLPSVPPLLAYCGETFCAGSISMSDVSSLLASICQSSRLPWSLAAWCSLVRCTLSSRTQHPTFRGSRAWMYNLGSPQLPPRANKDLG